MQPGVGSTRLLGLFLLPLLPAEVGATKPRCHPPVAGSWALRLFTADFASDTSSPQYALPVGVRTYNNYVYVSRRPQSILNNVVIICLRSASGL